MPYFEVLQDGFVKRPYDADLVLANIGNVWASKEAKLIIRIAFFCRKFMRCLECRF